MRRVRYAESKLRLGEISLLFVVIVMVGFAVMLAAGTLQLP